MQEEASLLVYKAVHQLYVQRISQSQLSHQPKPTIILNAFLNEVSPTSLAKSECAFRKRCFKINHFFPPKSTSLVDSKFQPPAPNSMSL